MHKLNQISLKPSLGAFYDIGQDTAPIALLLGSTWIVQGVNNHFYDKSFISPTIPVYMLIRLNDTFLLFSVATNVN